uniref:Uncharacterized protein n=1 Tax=mine drainage metagenome TaxID=410659 RepID=E6Q8U8_9ZZZZ
MSRSMRGLLPELEGWQVIFWITQDPCGATNVNVVQPVNVAAAKIMIAVRIWFISSAPCVLWWRFQVYCPGCGEPSELPTMRGAHLL